MTLKKKILTKAINTFVFVFVLFCCVGTEPVYSSKNDYFDIETLCNRYVDDYEVLRDSVGFSPVSFMDVPQELNEYLVKSAENGDFKLLKYAAIIALIVDTELSIKCMMSSDIGFARGDRNGFVIMLLKASGKYKNIDYYRDESGHIFMIRTNTLSHLVKENKINLSEEDYDYVQEKFNAYLKRKSYVVNECREVLHITDSIIVKIIPCDQIKKIEIATLNYIEMDYLYELEKCPNLESIEIEHPQNFSYREFHTSDGVLYCYQTLLLYPPGKKDRFIELPDDVSNFKASNNPYIQEIRFTHELTESDSVLVSNCKNIKKISTPKMLLYLKTDSLEYIRGENIQVNGKVGINDE